MRRRFLHRKTLWKGITDLYQADLVDLFGHRELQQLVLLSADLHQHLYQASLGDTAKQQNRQGGDVSKNICIVRPMSENAADPQGHRISKRDLSAHVGGQRRKLLHYGKRRHQGGHRQMIQLHAEDQDVALFHLQNTPRYVDVVQKLVDSTTRRTTDRSACRRTKCTQTMKISYENKSTCKNARGKVGGTSNWVTTSA